MIKKNMSNISRHNTLTAFLYVAALSQLFAVFGACSSNDEPGLQEQPAKELPIMFSASTVDGVISRAGAADTYDTSLPVGSQIGVYIYDSDNIDISTNQPVVTDPVTSTTWVYQVTGTVNSDGYAPLRLTSHVKNPRFPTISSTNTNYKSNVRVFAVFPNNTAFKPSLNTSNSYTFTVNSNQRTEDNIKASDLLTSDVATYTSTDCEQRLPIVLKHRMAKVTVVFTPKAGSDLTAANMPTNFDVLNVYPSVTVTPPKASSSVTTVSSGNGTKTSTSSPLQACTTHSFFIPPQTVAAGTTLLRFNVLGNESTAAYPTFKGIENATFIVPTGGVTFEASHQYLITVTVDVDFITMTGTITPWTNGGKLNYPLYTDSIL